MEPPPKPRDKDAPARFKAKEAPPKPKAKEAPPKSKAKEAPPKSKPKEAPPKSKEAPPKTKDKEAPPKSKPKEAPPESKAKEAPAKPKDKEAPHKTLVLGVWHWVVYHPATLFPTVHEERFIPVGTGSVKSAPFWFFTEREERSTLFLYRVRRALLLYSLLAWVRGSDRVTLCAPHLLSDVGEVPRNNVHRTGEHAPCGAPRAQAGTYFCCWSPKDTALQAAVVPGVCWGRQMINTARPAAQRDPSHPETLRAGRVKSLTGWVER
ncbi:hypothetical protein NDU88_006145 [Pleurodeles waltl]|uniref:Uncharacterized protein n=1 Tax=Pleurodeles waltl TaxID=8319 RepID=A0AAV7PHG8_PLEWA|nr:hypothetical protein NDU88_006145 [Pleurodeles waltl]